MTKEIRLLTGRHAGARVTLNALPTVIGNDEQSDIQISDWDQPAMQVIQREDGSLTIVTGDASGEAIVMEDFKPRRFGSVVLCVGDAEAQWPSDIELLETLLSPSPAPAPVSASTPLALTESNELAASAGPATATGTGARCSLYAGLAVSVVSRETRDGRRVKTGDQKAFTTMRPYRVECCD